MDANKKITLKDARAGEAEITQRPRYLQLHRKEARLREDQMGALSRVSRHLQRDKVAGGERITENTLIRIAVDLLLRFEAKLEGENEQELRASLEAHLQALETER